MKFFHFIIVFIFMLIGQKAFGESMTITVHFSHSELIIDTIRGGDGEIYNTLSYEDLTNDGELCTPALPIKHVSIPIPYYAKNISLRVEKSDLTSVVLANKIIPIQEDIPTLLGNYNTSFITCDSIIYNSALPYPIQNVQIVSIPCVGKTSRFVKVAVSPIRYYPKINKIEFAELINITIDYTIPTVMNNLQTDQTKESQTSNIGLPFYEYCVITRNSLKDSFDRLIAWRRQKGLNAGVVCIEDILNNPYITRDTVSNLSDNAGKLRQYLQYAYTSGITKYVLFGGNDSIIPIRYGTGFNNVWMKNEPNDYKIPSDFYFSESQSNWKADNDDYLGEPSDNLNYGGQLYVGRILCTKSQDVENYTNKLLRYELNPGNGDTSYLTKAFFQQADDMQLTSGGGQANIVAAALGGNFVTKKVIQEVPSAQSSNTVSPYGKEVIDSMKTHYGLVSWFGHGHPNAITTKSNSIYNEEKRKWNHLYQPYGISSVDDNVPYMMPETGNGLDCLENKFYPMVAYSVACTITPFDTYNEYTNFPNIGQSFTLGKDYGGPALVGNTRYGWVSWSYQYQKKFNEYAICEPLGEALVHARASFCSNSMYPHYLAHSSNLIGCPFIRLWTDIPSLFSASLSCTYNNCVISANCSIMDAVICIRDITQAEEVIDTISFNPSLGPKALTNVENRLITLTGKNCLPQIMPLPIQNTTLQGTHYAIVKNVSCGKDVRNGIQGNVTFSEGSDFTFETEETFKLTKGVAIKKGAKLKVTPSEIKK